MNPASVPLVQRGHNRCCIGGGNRMLASNLNKMIALLALASKISNQLPHTGGSFANTTLMDQQ